MKTVYKKAISLANKNGKKYLKGLLSSYKFIGMEPENSSNWFIIITQSNETGKYFCFAISRYDSGGADSCFYGDIEHYILQKAENMCYHYFSGLRFWLRANLIRAYEKQIKAKYNIKF